MAAELAGAGCQCHLTLKGIGVKINVIGVKIEHNRYKNRHRLVLKLN